MTLPEQYRFLTFSFDTASIPADVWVSLGQAMALCEQLSVITLPSSVAARLDAEALARGVAATTAIEGNTLSAEEVQRIVDTGSAEVDESRRHREREVVNIIDVFEEISASLQQGEKIAIDIDWLCAVNRKFLAALPEPPEVEPGRLREHEVTAGTYKAPPWNDVPGLLSQYVRWINRLRHVVTDASTAEERFVSAVLVALLAHAYAVWIHPFANGNGRLARLLELQILFESGAVPRIATSVLSAHYNANTAQYYAALNNGQTDVIGFLRYAIRGFVDELRKLAETVREEQTALIWADRPHEESVRAFAPPAVSKTSKE